MSNYLEPSEKNNLESKSNGMKEKFSELSEKFITDSKEVTKDALKNVKKKSEEAFVITKKYSKEHPFALAGLGMVTGIVLTLLFKRNKY